MRIISFLLAILLSSCVTVYSETAVKTGTVTLSSMRLSLLNGVAFVDFSGTGGVTLADYLNYKIKVCSVTDSAQCATGYIRSAGSGTGTFGTEKVTGGDFETNLCGSSWTCGTGWAQDAGDNGKATFSNASATSIQQTNASVTGTLYRVQFDIDAYSGARGFFQLASPGSISTGIFYTSTGTKTYYLLAAANYTRYDFFGNAGATITLDNLSVKAMILPTSSGVRIVSVPEGDTYNWLSNTITSQSNDTAGFTYSIYPVFAQTISGNDNTLSYGLIDCSDSPGMAGMLVTGTGNTIRNYTVARCPGGSFQFDESATLVNSIGVSSGPDITIASGKTVTGSHNLFGDAAKAGDGTYSDAGSTTLWSTDPVFVNPAAGDFRLQSTSPAIDAGTRE